MTNVIPKATNIKILNISAIKNKQDAVSVFGLGDDGNVYLWWAVHSHWVLFVVGESSEFIG